MKLLYALFFGAGVSAIVYSKFGRRIGYTNTQNIWAVIGVIFVMTTIIFYTVLATLGV